MASARISPLFLVKKMFQHCHGSRYWSVSLSNRWLATLTLTDIWLHTWYASTQSTWIYLWLLLLPSRGCCQLVSWASESQWQSVLTSPTKHESDPCGNYAVKPSSFFPFQQLQLRECQKTDESHATSCGYSRGRCSGRRWERRGRWWWERVTMLWKAMIGCVSFSDL